MVTSFQQTDDDADCPFDSYCAGSHITGTDTTAKKAVFGGVAGTSSIPVSARTAIKAVINYEITPSGSGSWKAGNWTVRMNVVAAHANVLWDEVYICRVSAGCSGISTIGSLTGMGIPCLSTGVKTAIVPGIAVASPGVGDKIIVVCLLRWTVLTGGEVQIFIKMSELIDTPLEKGGALSAAGAGAAAMVGRRSWRGRLATAGVGATALLGKKSAKAALTAAGIGALAAIGRKSLRGVLSSAGVGASSLAGTSNKPILRGMGTGAAAFVLKSVGRFVLNSAGLGTFSAQARATIPTKMLVAGEADTALIGAATASAVLEADGGTTTDFYATWRGWAAEPLEAPPNAGWTVEDVL